MQYKKGSITETAVMNQLLISYSTNGGKSLILGLVKIVYQLLNLQKIMDYS